jgi:hypothetical protein
MQSMTLAWALVAACCGTTEQLVTQQQKALTSLKSTVTTICKSWLDGNVSTTYARTALEAAATLLEKERAKLSASLDALTDPAAASLSDQENQLAQQIASLRKALADSDGAAVRQVMSAVGARQSQLP